MSSSRPYQNNVLSLGAGRYSDKKILCKYLADSSFAGSDKTKTYFINFMNSNRADFGVSTSIIWDIYLIMYTIRPDVDLFCFAVCSSDYPLRIGIKLMDEFVGAFLRKYSPGKISAASKENEFSKSSKEMMATLSDKYEDVDKVDALARAHAQLNDVKMTMSENINVMIENTESAESIYHLAKDINEEAQVFKKNTNKLKLQLRCRTYKWTFIIGLLVVIVIGAIVGVAYLFIMGKK